MNDEPIITINPNEPDAGLMHERQDAIDELNIAWTNPQSISTPCLYEGDCLHSNLVASYLLELVKSDNRHTIKFYCQDCCYTFDYIELVSNFVKKTK